MQLRRVEIAAGDAVADKGVVVPAVPQPADDIGELDGPLPDIPDQWGAVTGQTSLRNVVGWAREEGLTIRQLYERFAGARGQRTLKGSPIEIADDMAKWFLSYGVDGFLVQPAYLPGGLDDFVELVIPELQSRGLFRADYNGATLRENLGLKRPASRYASPSV